MLDDMADKVIDGTMVWFKRPQGSAERHKNV